MSRRFYAAVLVLIVVSRSDAIVVSIKDNNFISHDYLVSLIYTSYNESASLLESQPWFQLFRETRDGNPAQEDLRGYEANGLSNIVGNFFGYPNDFSDLVYADNGLGERAGPLFMWDLYPTSVETSSWPENGGLLSPEDTLSLVVPKERKAYYAVATRVVPDSGATFSLLGFSVLIFACLRRRLAFRES